MAEKAQHPSIMHKVEGTLLLQSPKTLGARSVLPHTKDASTCCKATQDLSMFSSTVSPVFVQAPSEKGLAGFLTDFLMGGVSAAVSKTAAAPIERVMLLIQNQDEMLKTGRLSELYKGIGECFSRTIKEEGVWIIDCGEETLPMLSVTSLLSLMVLLDLDSTEDSTFPVLECMIPSNRQTSG